MPCARKQKRLPAKPSIRELAEAVQLDRPLIMSKGNLFFDASEFQ